MKVYHNPDETGVTLSERDKEVIRIGADAVDSVTELANAVGFSVGDTDECDSCGEQATLRPYPISDGAGGLGSVANICADCQTTDVNAVIRKEQIESELQDELDEPPPEIDPDEVDLPPKSEDDGDE
jgi:hypothetical protein